VRSFVFDCDPLSFSQGDVVSVELEQGVFVMKIQRYTLERQLSARLLLFSTGSEKSFTSRRVDRL